MGAASLCTELAVERGVASDRCGGAWAGRHGGDGAEQRLADRPSPRRRPRQQRRVPPRHVRLHPTCPNVDVSVDRAARSHRVRLPACPPFDGPVSRRRTYYIFPSRPRPFTIQHWTIEARRERRRAHSAAAACVQSASGTAPVRVCAPSVVSSQVLPHDGRVVRDRLRRLELRRAHHRRVGRGQLPAVAQPTRLLLRRPAADGGVTGAC